MWSVLHFNCGAAQTEPLVKLSVLECVNCVIDYCPQNAAYVERGAHGPVNQLGRSCGSVPNHNSEVESGSQHELRIPEVSLRSWINESFH